MVFQGTLSVNHTGDEVIWEEYEFLCKPGALDRRPCLISPYHYRLDWLMWFAAFQVKQREETLTRTFSKLLCLVKNDTGKSHQCRYKSPVNVTK